MRKWNDLLGIDVLINEVKSKALLPEFLNPQAVWQVWNFHRSIPGYKATPLVSLPVLAERWGIKGVYVKDESQRFGLNAFKALGGIYALSQIVCQQPGLEFRSLRFNELIRPEIRDKIKSRVFATATDGNHGRGVAWSAAQLGASSVVFMPVGSSPYRVQKIYEAGAHKVVVTEVGYDDTVRMAAREAEKNGWTLVQDTSWPGYEEIPTWICQGYTTMAYEAAEQLCAIDEARPTHVFLQAGVGSMAAGVLGYFGQRYADRPPVVSVIEPSRSACFYASVLAQDGKPHAVTGIQETIMAGLNCGEPCTIAWPILRDMAACYFACPDYVAARGMRLSACPPGGGLGFVSGESGAVSLGLLSLIMERPELAEVKAEMEFTKDSVALMFSTEGDTDPIVYEKVLYDGFCPFPG